MPELIKEGRKLVTIRTINAINPIPNADAIEVATVDGWNVVIKKGEFEVGDYCVFFEIDAFLPATDLRFEFLSKNGTKTDEAGVERIRLRTIKLRKQISQGLALPLDVFYPELEEIGGLKSITGSCDYMDAMINLQERLEESRNGIEQYLNVTKYERPDERQNGGANRVKTAGNFPFVIPKTDEDRIQNVFGKFSQTMKGVPFRKSLKLDGSSQTITYFNNPDFFVEKVDEEICEWNEETQELTVVEVKPYPFQWESSQVVVCSRNLALKFDPTAAFWKAALKDDIPARLKKYCEDNNRQLALQGECMGAGIQGNRENLEEHTFYCFRIWDIDEQQFLDDADFITVTSLLGIEVCPLGDIVYFFDMYSTIQEALDSAEHASMVHPIAEGDVYKSTIKVDGETVHFKVINNKFLMKCED
ncbi:Phage protein [Yersinia phage fHe-Yen9-03]|uniref:Phage protein n=1 Tax=Yersinia phage fHe-Yen9-03 TaxID=2052743 RepID=A0A2C9CYY0_9CAUD|nr:Phage protein [Yersinia phage fHe-Yen9-03]